MNKICYVALPEDGRLDVELMKFVSTEEEAKKHSRKVMKAIVHFEEVR